VEQARKLFAWPPAPFEPAPPRLSEPHREQVLARVRKEPLKEGYLSIAWPSPPLVHDDVAALDALTIVLGHGEASRLQRALKRIGSSAARCRRAAIPRSTRGSPSSASPSSPPPRGRLCARR